MGAECLSLEGNNELKIKAFLHYGNAGKKLKDEKDRLGHTISGF